MATQPSIIETFPLPTATAELRRLSRRAPARNLYRLVVDFHRQGAEEAERARRAQGAAWVAGVLAQVRQGRPTTTRGFARRARSRDEREAAKAIYASVARQVR